VFDSHLTAAKADIEFVATTGQAKAGIAELRTLYEQSVGKMDTDALRLQVAQDKLNRTIQRSGPQSTAAMRATVAYRREMAALDAEARHTTVDLAREERTLSQFTRGALVGSGALGKLHRAAIFASGSLLGGFGLTYGLRSTVDAAREQEVALGHLETALAASGKNWHAYRGRIDEALNAQIRATGFTDNELAESLAAFIRRFGDVDKALHANAIAADVARAKNISLADAQTLVMRASFGNPRSLRILGIELTKVTANYDQLIATNKQAAKAEIDAAKAADLRASELAALDAVRAKYHGNAARFLKDDAGRQALFNAELDRGKEIIGAGLLPTLSRYLDKGTAWLSQEKNQQRLQRDTNEVLHDTGIVLHTLSSLIGPLAGDFRTFGKAVGGTENEIKLLTAAVTLLWARSKLIKWGLIAAGEKAVAVEAETAAAKVGLLSGRLGALGKLGTIVIPIVVAITYRKSIAKGLFHIPGLEDFAKAVDDKVPFLANLDKKAGVYPGQLDPGRYAAKTPPGYQPGTRGSLPSTRSNPGGYLPVAPPGYDPRTHGMAPSTADNPGGFLPSKRNQPTTGAPSSGEPGKPKPAKFTDVIPASITAAIARAQYEGDKRAQRQALKDEEGFLLRQLHLAHTDAQRGDIYQQLAGVKSELDALDAAAGQLRKKSAAEALRRQTRAFDTREARFRRREDRAEAADTRTSRSTGVTTHAAERRADRAEVAFLHAYIRDRSHALKLRQKADDRLAQLEKHLAKIEKNTSQNAFAKQAQAFLEELSGAIRQYAPNIEIANHYQRPPEDPHAHAKQQRRAAAAAFA
jgi:hypothetical protein